MWLAAASGCYFGNYFGCPSYSVSGRTDSATGLVFSLDHDDLCFDLSLYIQKRYPPSTWKPCLSYCRALHGSRPLVLEFDMSEKRNSILFFTNSEWGQANVILATIHELLILDEFDIHLASYSTLQSRLDDIFQTHAAAYPRPLKIVSGEQPKWTSDDKNAVTGSNRPSITFHTIPGHSIAELCHRDGIAASLPHVPGLKGGVASYARLEEFFFRHSVDEYMEQQRSSKGIVSGIQPAVILAEQGFCPGLDACNELGRPFTILSPNSFKDFEQRFQPWMGMLWKYPAYVSIFYFFYS